MLFIAPTAFAIAILAQQPAAAPKPQVTVLKAGIDQCSADFTVKDADGKPVYGATIHVRVRYGFLGVKRADLEVGTNSDGKARIEGLPKKARPLFYEIKHGNRTAEVEQKVEDACEANFDVSLK